MYIYIYICILYFQIHITSINIIFLYNKCLSILKFFFCETTNNIGTAGVLCFFQAVFSMDGDTLVEKQTGPGFETTNKRTVSGNTLTMVGTERLNNAGNQAHIDILSLL